MECQTTLHLMGVFTLKSAAMKLSKFFLLPAIAGTATVLFTVPGVVPPQAANGLQIVRKQQLSEKTYLVKGDSDSLFTLPSGKIKSPALLVKKEAGDSSSVPLRITSCQVEVQVIGTISRTTLDLTFYNDLNRQLEGEFCFPLGDGQRVSGFALEVEGKMREGVVVGKTEGRQIFESVVRRRIDPGLLEWTAGNNFRARVFPILAKASKHIRVTFESELLSAPGAYVYFLPMDYQTKIDEFSIRAEVIRQVVKPETYGKGVTTLEFSSWNNSWTASKKMKDYLPNIPIAFDIPRTEQTQKVFMEKGKGDSAWFCLSLEPAKYKQAKKLPSKICLLWDVSGSGAGRNIKKEEEILERYFGKIQDASVRLVTFSSDVHSSTEYKLEKGQWTALHAAIDSLDYDGGTQLGAINLKKYSCDEFLLFSDGLSNFGQEEMITGTVPVMAITSSQLADYEYLRHLVRVTNGQFINALNCTAQEAEQKLETQPYRFISATYDGNTITQVYPSISTDVGRTMTFSGMMKGTEGEITLNFGFGSEIVATEKVKLSRATGGEVPESVQGILPAIWAQKKMEELEGNAEKNKEEIAALGKKYSVVSRYTSLLVLDRLEDYMQYQVMPPEGNLREEYLARTGEEHRIKVKSDKEHMETVVHDFNERQEWWKKDYKPDTNRFKWTDGEGRTHGYNYSIRADSVSGNTGSMSLQSVQITNSNAVTYNFSSNGASRETNAGSAQSYESRALDENVVLADDMSAEKADKKAEGRGRGEFKENHAVIELKTWDPQTPYMIKLKEAKPGMLLATYRKLRESYKKTPSFFLDASDYFAKQGENKEAVRILSNLAELNAEDHQALRVLAHRLEQQGYLDLSILTFRKIQKIRSEEPQSYRDLGLALAANKEYPEALHWLCKVVNHSWDPRFPKIESLVVCEINHILGVAGGNIRPDSLDPRLVAAMPVDVRVVINWDSNDCDLDLWTTDPYGELCMYNHPLTVAGGRISSDFTGGYGPEEFIIKKASKGKYNIQVNYFGNHQQNLYGPATVQAELYTNYGKPNEVKKVITLRLKDNKEVVDIGALSFKGN
jgi:tetratricopeptide (TPR) repeat protein